MCGKRSFSEENEGLREIFNTMSEIKNCGL
jgi:hypothetical protein